MNVRTASIPLFITLAACGVRSAGTLRPAVSPRPTASESPPAFPLPSSTPNPSPTATPRPACLTQPGRMEKGEVRDGRLVRAVPFRIYLPACAGKPGFERLPALYLLHGLTYDDGQWDRLGAPALADQMIAAGEAPPFLMVMPWERTGLDMDLAITDVLLPYIETTYPAGAGSRLRAIGGLSRGGGWALRIGLRHPWTFGAIGLHSPAVISPDLFWLSAWAEGLTPKGTPRVWIDIGQRDGLRPEAVALEQTLDELGISAALEVNPGEHTEAYWAEHLPEYFAWYVTPWREMALP